MIKNKNCSHKRAITWYTVVFIVSVAVKCGIFPLLRVGSARYDSSPLFSFTVGYSDTMIAGGLTSTRTKCPNKCLIRSVTRPNNTHTHSLFPTHASYLPTSESTELSPHPGLVLPFHSTPF